MSDDWLALFHPMYRVNKTKSGEQTYKHTSTDTDERKLGQIDRQTCYCYSFFHSNLAAIFSGTYVLSPSLSFLPSFFLSSNRDSRQLD